MDYDIRVVPVTVPGAERYGGAQVYVVTLKRPDYMDDTPAFRVRVTTTKRVTMLLDTVEVWIGGRWLEVGAYFDLTPEQAALQAIRDLTEGIEDEW